MNRKIATVLLAIVMVAAAALFMMSTASGADYYVDDAGSTYTDINAAIAAADTAVDTDPVITVDSDQTEIVDITSITNDFTTLTIMSNGTEAIVIGGDSGDTITYDPAESGALILGNLELTDDGAGGNEFVFSATGAETVEFYNVTFDDSLVTFSDNMIAGYHMITPRVFYMGSTEPVQGAELNISVDGVTLYQTPYYGGVDAPTDAMGMIAEQDIMNATWDASGVEWSEVWYETYYMEDAECMIAPALMNVNMTGYLDIYLTMDVRAPAALVNVTATPVDEQAINLTWNASMDAGFSQYKVYKHNGTAYEWLANTTMTYYEDSGLMASTLYMYNITQEDTGMLESPGVAVQATTMAGAVTGTVDGTVTFGAMSRSVMNATVELYNGTTLLDTAMVNNTTGNNTYSFTGITLPVNCTVMVTPEDEYDAGTMTDGYMAVTSAEFELNDTDNMETVDVDLVWTVYTAPLPVITGTVTYEASSMNLTNATNGITVELYFNGSMVASDVTDAMGNYSIAYDAGVNYTLMASPKTALAYDDVAGMSGYLDYDSGLFDLSADVVMDFEFAYMVYVAPLPVVSGQITYETGLTNMTNATYNLTVEILNETGVVIATGMTDMMGNYSIEVAAGVNYTIKVSPLAMYLYDAVAMEDGYLAYESDMFNVTGDLTMDIEFEFMAYVAPTYMLNGTVTYDDGNVSVGATVELLNDTMVAVMTTTTDAMGYYMFSGIAMDAVYSLQVTPPASMAGETDVKSGYLASTPKALTFTADMTEDVVLAYYTYVDTHAHTLDITAPTAGEKFKSEATITVSGTSDAEGEDITVTLGAETATATVTSGAWTVDITAPKDEGTYTITATVDTVSDTVSIEVEKEEDEEAISPLVIAAIVIVVIIVVVVIIAAIFFLRKKGAEEEEGFEEDEDEDEEDEDEEDEDEDYDEEDEDEDEEYDEEDEEEDEEYDEEDEDEDEDDEEYDDEDDEEYDDEDDEELDDEDDEELDDEDDEDFDDEEEE